jgi:hypothetical protein
MDRRPENVGSANFVSSHESLSRSLGEETGLQVIDVSGLSHLPREVARV